MRSPEPSQQEPSAPSQAPPRNPSTNSQSSARQTSPVVAQGCYSESNHVQTANRTGCVPRTGKVASSVRERRWRGHRGLPWWGSLGICVGQRQGSRMRRWVLIQSGQWKGALQSAAEGSATVKCRETTDSPRPSTSSGRNQPRTERHRLALPSPETRLSNHSTTPEAEMRALCR